MTAIEIDPRRARRLHSRTPGHVTVVCDDILRCALPRDPYVLVGNLPFHLTTAIVRRVLAADHWQSAVLLVQWEVARRRAGVGGASMMTARWWPWYDFALHSRVPARAFRPVPSVDGGLLTVHRRPRPLVDDRKRYQDFVGRVFTGRGRGLPDILTRTGQFDRRDLMRLAAGQPGVTADTAEGPDGGAVGVAVGPRGRAAPAVIPCPGGHGAAIMGRPAQPDHGAGPAQP